VVDYDPRMLRDPRVERPVKERSRRRRIAIHAAAAIAMVVWGVVLTFAFAIFSFGFSVCGPATAHEVHAYRDMVLELGLVGALGPLAVAMLLRRLGERAAPWFAVAGFVVVMAVIARLTAQPSRWCF
jgi:hypothetical protein